MANIDPEHNLLLAAVDCLSAGQVIVYPVESMYGLGCDPFNRAAVEELLAIKNRDSRHGLILIASGWHQIEPLVGPITNQEHQQMQDSWPSNTTWLVPKSSKVPVWISGEHETIAVRIPDHADARKICELFGGPIVSTSANRSGEQPCQTLLEALEQFGKQLYVVPIDTSGYTKPSTIRHLGSGKIVR